MTLDDELIDYYQRELTYLRRQGSEFARSYPDLAGRLEMSATTTADPHVERLLEGVAFLTARVRKKVDDEFPEITQALLEVLYPHLLRPIPSLTIVQFEPGPDAAKLAEGYVVPADSRLESVPVRGQTCRFRTVYPARLWGVEVREARLHHDRVTEPSKPRGAVSMLEITLGLAPGLPPGRLPIDRLRFYLDGDPARMQGLYELLLNRCCGVRFVGQTVDGTRRVVDRPGTALEPVGFDVSEALVPAPVSSFPGYRLLLEYFAFPEKFLFVDVVGLSDLPGDGWTGEVKIQAFFDRAPRTDLSADSQNFRLGCTPAVNLFPQTAEPIALDQTRSEYPVVPDVYRPLATEVFTVDEVTSSGTFLDEPQVFDPLFSFRHRSVEARKAGARPCWMASRRASSRRGDPGTDVVLSFVQPDLRPTRPAADMLTVRTTCTNRDLPAELPFGGDQGDFRLEAPGPVGRVRCLKKPTRPVRPPLGRRAYWPLVSHLSLNHLSLSANDGRGLQALREILRLYEWVGQPAARKQIEGLVNLKSQRVPGRVGRGVVTGVELRLRFDEAQFVGSGVYLMASVLERFFGLYASVNSFTQLVAELEQSSEVLKRWPPRIGDRPLL